MAQTRRLKCATKQVVEFEGITYKDSHMTTQAACILGGDHVPCMLYKSAEEQLISHCAQSKLRALKGSTVRLKQLPTVSNARLLMGTMIKQLNIDIEPVKPDEIAYELLATRIRLNFTGGKRGRKTTRNNSRN